MILPDANLLLYATDAGSPNHRRARQWLEQQLSSTQPTAFAWVALLAFVRIGTRARAFAEPLSVKEAFAYIEEWLAQPVAVVVHPGDRHPVILRDLLQTTGTAANLVPDAHLAALAIEYGAAVATADRDFERFPGVRVVYPLSGT